MVTRHQGEEFHGMKVNGIFGLNIAHMYLIQNCFKKTNNINQYYKDYLRYIDVLGPWVNVEEIRFVFVTPVRTVSASVSEERRGRCLGARDLPDA